MTRTRLGLLGLCAMVFGLMAFSASAAQAETGAKWLILKSAGVLQSEGEVNEGKASVLLSAVTPGVLHTQIAGVAVLFECTTLSAEKAFLLASGSIGESKGNVKGSKVKFSGCVTKLNGVVNAACKPNDKVAGSGSIVTAAGHALIELHELKPSGVKDDVVRILPDSGETFATIELGEECSIGEKVPVIGKATLKDCSDRTQDAKNEKGEEIELETNPCEKELFLEHRTSHQVEAGPLTELWTISKTAEHVATILGSALASLGGTGAGLKWSGDPA